VLTGEELLLSRGPALEAALASAAIPACLAPGCLGGSRVDGWGRDQ